LAKKNSAAAFTADCDQPQFLRPIFGGRKIFGGGG